MSSPRPPARPRSDTTLCLRCAGAVPTKAGLLWQRLKATKSINTGDEVLIAYGNDFSNEMLLVSFGFIVPGNTTALEVTVYSLDLIVYAAKQAGITSIPTTTGAWKQKALSDLRHVPQVGIPSVVIDMSHHPGSDTPTVFSQLSLESDAHYPLETLPLLIIFLLSTRHKGDFPIEEIFATLKSIYQLQLSSYETTVSEDLAILAKPGSLTPAMRLAVEYRLDVKKTLLDRISRCNTARSSYKN